MAKTTNMAEKMVKGYKVFNPDWTCRGFQYEVGKTYEMNDTPWWRKKGFHFCENAVDCFNYYQFNPNNKVAEVIALGEVDVKSTISCTNKIQIVREIPWNEVLEIVNTGNGNTGYRNSGDYNSGDYNSGDYNSGNWNSGDLNSGNSNSGRYNSGDYNSGRYNSGDYNSGEHNSGNWNSGNYNSGTSNSGDYNSGEHNSGNWNSGNYNSGTSNSGDYNSGKHNSGYSNIGNYNTGNSNSGDNNCGDWNKGDWNTGCFNTTKSHITFFNKPTSITFNEWRESDAYCILGRMPQKRLDWISMHSMSDAEKEIHPEFETTGGYLKEIDTTNERRQEWWNKLPECKKEIIKAIPNFDAAIFEEITGIKVD